MSQVSGACQFSAKKPFQKPWSEYVVPVSDQVDLLIDLGLCHFTLFI